MLYPVGLGRLIRNADDGTHRAADRRTRMSRHSDRIGLRLRRHHQIDGADAGEPILREFDPRHRRASRR